VLKQAKHIWERKKQCARYWWEIPKKVIISNDCRDKNRIEYYCKLSGTDHIGVNLSSLTLGEYCGKPFPISSLTIINPGDSNILDMKE